MFGCNGNRMETKQKQNGNKIGGVDCIEDALSPDATETDATETIEVFF
jgi:hypothetical protein